MSITVRQVMTADNADVLNGTDLENIPGGGFLFVASASSQNDTLMSITGRGFEIPFREQALPLRSGGQPLEDDDPISILIPEGGKVIINVDVVTAATAVVVAHFVPLDEL